MAESGEHLASCRGFPNGKVCDRPIEFAVQGLCRACYSAQFRYLKRVDREYPAEEPPARPFGGFAEPRLPHECPCCGQPIPKGWARRNPALKYDRNYHPISLKRALAVHKSRATIAKRFGITEAILETWIEQFPEMTAAVHAVEAEAGILYEAAVNKALGRQSESGGYRGGDTSLLMFLLLKRHRITERKPPAADDSAQTLEKAIPIALKLLKKLKGATASENPPDDEEATDAKR